MASVNKAILVGNLGQDPEIKYTQSGMAVANFSMATQEKWEKDGNKQEKTEWHRIVAWGKLAEICSEYLKKGSPVYIEGRIQTRSWEDKEGIKKYTTEIVANSMQMLGSKQAREREEKKPGADYEPINIYEPISIPEDSIPF